VECNSPPKLGGVARRRLSAAPGWFRLPKISTQPSPIADLEHPFASIYKDSAKGCSRSAIGDG
jgi:hypothetical protein